MSRLALVAVVALFSCVYPAHADHLYYPRIVNNDHQTLDAVVFCIGADFCHRVTIDCAPGEMCVVPLHVPHGCFDLTVQGEVATLVGSRSNTLRNLGFSASLCHDANGDGRVSTIDWSSFVEAFRAF